MNKNIKTRILITLSAALLGVLIYNAKNLIFPGNRSLIHHGNEKRMVNLFFLSENGKLVAEDREILGGNTVLDDIKICLQELMKGPTNRELASVIPQGSGIREVFLDDNKCAYLDFNRNFSVNHIGGTRGELNTLDAVAKTVMDNFSEVTSVKILIEGEEITSLAGHIDLTNPLKKRQ